MVDGGLTQAPTAAQVIAEAYEELSLDKPTNFGKDSILFIQHMQSHPYMPTHAQIKLHMLFITSTYRCV